MAGHGHRRLFVGLTRTPAVGTGHQAGDTFHIGTFNPTGAIAFDAGEDAHAGTVQAGAAQGVQKLYAILGREALGLFRAHPDFFNINPAVIFLQRVIVAFDLRAVMVQEIGADHSR